MVLVAISLLLTPAGLHQALILLFIHSFGSHYRHSLKRDQYGIKQRLQFVQCTHYDVLRHFYRVSDLLRNPVTWREHPIVLIIRDQAFGFLKKQQIITVTTYYIMNF
jgi:hypothetical protein